MIFIYVPVRARGAAPRVLFMLLAATLMASLACHAREPPIPVAPAAGVPLAPFLSRMLDRHLADARRRPADAQVHGTLGMIYEANDMPALALRSYENAQLLDPQNPGWPYHAALCLEMLERLPEASARYEALQRRFPEFAPAWHSRANLQLRDGKVDEAAAGFERALTLAPHEPTALAAVADCRIRQGRAAEAIELLEKALARSPHAAGIHYQLGLAYRQLGDLARAGRHLSAGADAKPTRLQDAIGRQISQYDAGINRIVDRALDLLEAQRAAQAATLLEEVLTSHPNEVSVMNNLAAAYLDLGRQREALDLIDRALRLQPTNFRTHVNRAMALMSVKRWAEAEASAAAAVEYAPQASESHFALAQIRLHQSRFEQARPALEACLRLDPSHLRALMALAEVHARAGRWGEARDRFARVVELAPDDLNQLGNLAIAHCQLEELEPARTHLAELRRRQPDHPMIEAVMRNLAQRGGAP